MKLHPYILVLFVIPSKRTPDKSQNQIEKSRDAALKLHQSPIQVCKLGNTLQGEMRHLNEKQRFFECQNSAQFKSISPSANEEVTKKKKKTKPKKK